MFRSSVLGQTSGLLRVRPCLSGARPRVRARWESRENCELYSDMPVRYRLTVWRTSSAVLVHELYTRPILT